MFAKAGLLICFLSGDNISRHNRTGACKFEVLPGNRLHAPLKNLCVNKKHCYEKQLLPVDSGGSLLQTDMLLYYFARIH